MCGALLEPNTQLVIALLAIAHEFSVHYAFLLYLVVVMLVLHTITAEKRTENEMKSSGNLCFRAQCEELRVKCVSNVSTVR